MVKQLTNDENIANLKKRKTLRIFIIIFATITILLAILTLVSELCDSGFKFSVLYALIAYIITAILNRKRDSIPINISPEIEKIREEIKKNKAAKKAKKVKKASK